jgi:hypothetical protein
MYKKRHDNNQRTPFLFGFIIHLSIVFTNYQIESVSFLFILFLSIFERWSNTFNSYNRLEVFISGIHDSNTPTFKKNKPFSIIPDFL